MTTSRIFSAISGVGALSSSADEEGLPLLDEISDDEFSGEDLLELPSAVVDSMDDEDLTEVIIHNSNEEEFAVIHNKVVKPFFYQDIQKCLDILNAAEKKSEGSIQKSNKLYWYYSSLFIFNLAVAIACPLTLLKLMMITSENKYQQLLPGWKKIVADLMPQLQAMESKYKPMRKAYDRISVLHDKWWNDDQDDNCLNWSNGTMRFNMDDLGVNYFEFNDYPCIFAERNITHPMEYCHKITNEACELFANYLNQTSNNFRQAAWRMFDLKHDMDALNNTIIPIQAKINGRHFMMETIEPYSTSAFVAVCVAVIAMSLYYAVGYRNAHHECEDDVNNAKLVITNIKDPVHANLIINLVGRLGLKLDNLSMQEFKHALENQMEQINKRWQCRLAFLCGAEQENAINHRFLKADGSKDITRQIFEYAEFMPEPPAIKLAT